LTANRERILDTIFAIRTVVRMGLGSDTWYTFQIEPLFSAYLQIPHSVRRTTDVPSCSVRMTMVIVLALTE
jgi:hypothetical protein